MTQLFPIVLLLIWALSVLCSAVPKHEREALLRECKVGRPASCTFLPTGPGGVQIQGSRIGNPFSNCLSNQHVKHTISGSATATDSWGVEAMWKSATGAGHALARLGMSSSELSVASTVERSEGVTMSQSIEFDIPPGIQTALIGVAKFKAVCGKMLLQYPNKTR